MYSIDYIYIYISNLPLKTRFRGALRLTTQMKKKQSGVGKANTAFIVLCLDELIRFSPYLYIYIYTCMNVYRCRNELSRINRHIHPLIYCVLTCLCRCSCMQSDSSMHLYIYIYVLWYCLICLSNCMIFMDISSTPPSPPLGKQPSLLLGIRVLSGSPQFRW